jgi:hypothetical protein
MKAGRLGEFKEHFSNLEDLEKDGLYLLACFLIIGLTAGVNNIQTPDEPVNVGYVEVETECVGIEAGFCLGIQRQSHTTYNYDNYEKPEPGTENFYRRVEAELMAQSYNICDSDMSGMDWTSEADYRNKSGSEWLENENVELLPCEQAFYRNLSAAK